MRWVVWSLSLSLIGGGALGAGCTSEPLDPIPMFDPGTVSEGDCDLEQIEQRDAEIRVAFLEADDPLVILPGDFGRVLTSNNEYEQFMWNANFNTEATNFPWPDFSTYNAAATWIAIPNGCGFEIRERHLNRKTNGDLVFDVLFYDAARNCSTVCGETHNVLVIDLVPKNEDVSICRRITPGCAPPE